MDDKSGKPLPSGGVEQKKDVKPVSVPATASKEQNATGFCSGRGDEKNAGADGE